MLTDIIKNYYQISISWTQNSIGAIADFEYFDVVVFGSCDDKLHLLGAIRHASQWSVAHRQTHDSCLVASAQFASAAEFTNVPNAHLTASCGVEHGATLTAQSNIVNQRLS